MTETTTANSPIALEKIFMSILVRDSEIHGKGIFAGDFIKRDSVIGIYHGPRVQEDGTYVLWIDCEKDGIYGIDGCNELRFTNHSSAPNASFEGPELIALRDIEAGEELTFHYGDEWEDLENSTGAP